MHPQCLVLPQPSKSHLHVFRPGYLELRLCMSHVYVCKAASFGVAASKPALASFPTKKLNIARAQSSLIHHARLFRRKTSIFPVSHPSCPSSLRHTRELWSSSPTTNHPQPSSLSSHVRGNYPNRQTGKVNFAALQKFAPERARRSSRSTRSWSTASLYYTVQYPNIHVAYTVIRKQNINPKLAMFHMRKDTMT